MSVQIQVKLILQLNVISKTVTFLENTATEVIRIFIDVPSVTRTYVMEEMFRVNVKYHV